MFSRRSFAHVAGREKVVNRPDVEEVDVSRGVADLSYWVAATCGVRGCQGAEWGTRYSQLSPGPIGAGSGPERFVDPVNPQAILCNIPRYHKHNRREDQNE